MFWHYGAQLMHKTHEKVPNGHKNTLTSRGVTKIGISGISKVSTACKPIRNDPVPDSNAAKISTTPRSSPLTYSANRTAQTMSVDWSNKCIPWFRLIAYDSAWLHMIAWTPNLLAMQSAEKGSSIKKEYLRLGALPSIFTLDPNV